MQFIKIVPTKEPVPKKSLSQRSDQQQLQIQGFTDNGEVLFKYTNKDQKLEQTFGLHLQKYIGQQKHNMAFEKQFMNKMLYQTLEEMTDGSPGDGAYIFKPDWRDPLPHPYSSVN